MPCSRIGAEYKSMYLSMSISMIMSTFFCNVIEDEYFGKYLSTSTSTF